MMKHSVVKSRKFTKDSKSKLKLELLTLKRSQRQAYDKNDFDQLCGGKTNFSFSMQTQKFLIP